MAAVKFARTGSGDSAVLLTHVREIEERIERLEKTVGSAVDLLHRLLHPERAPKPGAKGR